MHVLCLFRYIKTLSSVHVLRTMSSKERHWRCSAGRRCNYRGIALTL